MAIDIGNCSVNFHGRLAKKFFFGYLFLPFLFVFYYFVTFTIYTVQTHSVFPIGEVYRSPELLKKGCLEFFNVLQPHHLELRLLHLWHCYGI